MNHLSTSAISFRAKILEKNSPWSYIHTGVYITMGEFGRKILYFKALKMLHLALHLFAIMW